MIKHITIGLTYSMTNQFIFYHASINKEILQIRLTAREGG